MLEVVKEAEGTLGDVDWVGNMLVRVSVAVDGWLVSLD